MKTHPLALPIAALCRLVSGAQVRWTGCAPSPQQRVYFANHTSNLDFVVLWSALPPAHRAVTRPVAARDYWQYGVRSFLARRVFDAVLIDRSGKGTASPLSCSYISDQLVHALGKGYSLILFPEGTRGDGKTMAPFRSGLYHLAKQRPEVEFVPVYLENLSRILPKGEVLPVPLISILTFGVPLQLEPGEHKTCFLTRARAAVLSLRREGSV